MKISVEPFGTLPDGGQVLIYGMENNNGMRVEILNYGGIFKNLFVPDRDGNTADIVLGYDKLEDYIKNDGMFGAIVGRNANRIADGMIEIFGKSYLLEKNDGNCNLHGGSQGLAHRLFSSEVRTFNNLPALLLSHTIEDMSDGFPGTLTVTIAYALTDDNAVMIDYRAAADNDTIINLSNHSYFNLAGHGSGSVGGHTLDVGAAFYTPNTPEGYPYGEILSVENTPFDFRGGRRLDRDWEGDHPQTRMFGGYDHNLVLSGTDYRKVASVSEPSTGRMLELFTDLPGMQLYTANSLPERTYKEESLYKKHAGFCLETQLFPNAAKIPWFPSPLFCAGEEYTATTTYQFSTF